jgi:hypothetical protein
MLFSRVTPTVANHQLRLQRDNQAPAKGENYSGGKMSFHMRRENRVRNHTIKGLALAAGAFLVAVALSASANAATLRRGSTSGSSSVTGSEPGSVLWTYYDTCYTGEAGAPSGSCNSDGNGDNIIRLINPNGSGNGGLAGEHDTPVCAMVYVFDDNEEMVECCGCPITSAGLLTLSVDHDLLSDPILGGTADGVTEGAIAILATLPTSGTNGCAPGNSPGFTPSAATANLLGSITHNQAVGNISSGSTSGLTEIGLFDDANGDSANVTYLENECSALEGNGSGHGICGCGFGS